MKERIIHLDILRLIAMISVIVMHTTGAVQRFYSDGIDTTFLLTNIPNSITRFSVPLFVMISGRLMINRGHDYRFLLRKSAHYMGIFFFWSLIYTVVLTELPYLKTQGVKPLLINTVIDSLSGWFHFWFLFLICGLYLVLPFIEIIVNHISGKLLRYYIILNIVFCFIGKTLMSLSFFNEIFGTHLDDFLVGFLNIYTFYFMLGYWLKDCSFKKDKLLWAGMCAGLLFNAIVGNITSFLSGDRMVSLIDAQSPSTLLVCVCLFMLSRKIEITDDRAKRIIALLSELSFGVYLIHMLIIETMKKFFPLIGSPFAACIVTVSVTTFIGFGISWILWKNRITRRVIR